MHMLMRKILKAPQCYLKTVLWCRNVYWSIYFHNSWRNHIDWCQSFPSSSNEILHSHKSWCITLLSQSITLIFNVDKGQCGSVYYFTLYYRIISVLITHNIHKSSEWNNNLCQLSRPPKMTYISAFWSDALMPLSTGWHHFNTDVGSWGPPSVMYE